MKLNFMLQPRNLLVYVARLRKKNIIFNMENFGKNCWENESDKTKVFNHRQRGFILTTLCNKKTSDTSLYLRLRIIERKSVFFLETIRV